MTFMVTTDQFSSRLIESPGNSRIPCLQPIKDNQPFGGPLEGALIEAQYKVGERYLLFVTDDVPYEETLRIYLISGNAEILDSLEFGSYLGNGMLENLNIAGKQTIEFSFIHAKRCRLTVENYCSWKKPMAFTPGVRRPGKVKKRYLALAFV